MDTDFGYRLLRGRKGASGHVRAQDGRQTLAARGLSPGEKMQVYRMADGKALPSGALQADGDGNARLTISGAGVVFAAAEDQVTLWEEGDGDARYFQASQALTKLRTPGRAVQVAAQAAKQAEKPAAASPIEEKPIIPEPEPILLEETAEEIVEEAMEENSSSEAEPPAEYHLRPESAGEPIDALPPLIWPAAAADLRPYFETQSPIAPFDAPGWRFVRVPSPLRGVPYCAVGYHAQDCRVTQVAYAVPGTPHHAPAALPGYRYQVGREGKGYWTLWRRVEA